MIRLRRSTKYFIVVAVFVVSILVGLDKSKLHKNFGEKKSNVNVTTASELFKKAGHFKKIKMSFYPKDYQAARKTIANELGKKGITRKFWDSTPNYMILVSEVPDSCSSEIISKLRNIQGLSEDKIYTDSDQDILINVEEHLKNKKLVKERIKSDLSNSNRRMTEDGIARLERSLSRIQTEIDSLSNQVEIHKRKKEHNLLFVTAIKQDTKSSMKHTIQDFILTTVVMIISLTIALVIFYFLLVGLLRLMKKLGIRTAQESGKYSYNYNKYYGYGSRNKRVKRIYKDKKEDNQE